MPRQRSSPRTIGDRLARIGAKQPPPFAHHCLPDSYVITEQRELLRLVPPRGDAEQPPRLVAPRPVGLTAMGVDPESGEHYVDLCFEAHGGAWRTKELRRDHIAVSRLLASVAAFGVPVTTNTAPELTKFLSAYQVCNAEKIGPRVILRRQGYHGSTSEPWYACGDRAIGPFAPTTITYAPNCEVRPCREPFVATFRHRARSPRRSWVRVHPGAT